MFSIKIDFSKEFANIILNNDVNHYNLLQIAVEYSDGQSSEEYKIIETFCEKWGIVYNNLNDDEIASLYKEMDKAINAIMYYRDFYMWGKNRGVKSVFIHGHMGTFKHTL